MIAVELKGVLGKKFGEKWELEVDSVYEIFEAIQANKRNSAKIFADAAKLASHFIVFVNDKILASYSVFSKILKPNDFVKIIPIVQGGSPMVLFVIGMMLQVLSMILLKALSPKKPKDVKTSSNILTGTRNVSSRNVVVPIGYGRMRVGSVVISNDSIVRSIKLQTDENSTALGYFPLFDAIYRSGTNQGIYFFNASKSSQGIDPYIMI